uniref:NADH dehydrogenase [ubiquinone] 1 alpha subcomplex subunit 11 n=1 Tax=Pelusios castaneus TaxID=367368 RepID=A0A8C8SNU2_9SAUR
MSWGLGDGYWDIPEGTDCPRKTLITGRIGAALGLLASGYRLILHPADSAVDAVQTAARNTVMMATMGAVFGLTTCLSAHVREDPEDALNYFVGGCASGIVMGVRTHNFGTGSSACLSLGLLAAITKIGKREGWKIGGPPRL